jgi:hypothetical protein
VKEKMIYGVSFLLVFALVSGTLVFLNNIYNNIFKFDFSPIKIIVAHQDKNLQQNPAADSLKKDSLNTRIDSLATKKDSTLLTEEKADSTKKINKKENGTKPKSDEAKKGAGKNNQGQPVQTAIAAQNVPTPPIVQPISTMTKSRRDSTYNKWVKETVKLYESMDSRKAAKVIQGYSDNIARDILFKMKKKKAAEILAELKPEVVTRIISVN